MTDYMAEHASSPTRIAVVAIGRNEGRRMVDCLQAAMKQSPGSVIYVDSGSTDGSVARARDLGAVVLELDTAIPFTAARARNFGLEYVRANLPDTEFLQFLDADCEMRPGWLEAGAAALRADPSVAGVAGILRERYPESSPYNRLCDMEWQVPPGETRALGGNALFRVSALGDVGGYNPGLIAGEEPEMCVRLRERGWRLWRLESPMALHDAGMTRMAQWWNRAVRFGFAQAQVSRMHHRSPQRIWARETRSTVIWALVPSTTAIVATIVLASTLGGWRSLLGLLPLLLYDALALKIFIARRRRGDSRADALLYAVAATIAKFPQFQGLVRFVRSRFAGRPASIIEYKPPATRGEPRPAPP
jgi:GT2 family glycosyltransferase